MKRIYLTVGALLVCLFLSWFLCMHLGNSRWYGHCRIGTGYPLVELISVNGEVYYDQNADTVPQPEELIPRHGSLEIRSFDGKSMATIQDVSTALDPRGLSDSYPQLIDLKIQSNEFHAVWQLGTIVMSRDPDKAGVCHVLGPLSFIPRVSGIELKPGEKTELRISVGTLQQDSAIELPNGIISSALVSTSVDGDRDRSTYAFDKTLRPKMEISFGNIESESKIIVFDGFC